MISISQGRMDYATAGRTHAATIWTDWHSRVTHLLPRRDGCLVLCKLGLQHRHLWNNIRTMQELQRMELGYQ
jgi:hypothetical protein